MEGTQPPVVVKNKREEGRVVINEPQKESALTVKNDIIRKVRACIEHDDMFEQRDSSSKKRLSFPEMSC